MNLLGIIFSLLFLWMLFVTFKRWYRLNKSWLVFPFRNKNKVAPSDSEVRQYVLFVLVRFVAFVVLFVIGLLLAKQFPVLYKELF